MIELKNKFSQEFLSLHDFILPQQTPTAVNVGAYRFN